MLDDEQIEYAKSLKDYDTFWDDVALLHVHIGHDKKGMFFLIMDENFSVYKTLSCFLPYLWVSAANARLWPRDVRGQVRYYTQMQVEKHGDKYINKKSPCTVKDKNRVGFKKDIRSKEEIFSFLKRTSQ